MRVVVTRGREARRQFEAPRQQVFRIDISADARRHFRQHADGRHVRGMALQVLTKHGFGFGNAVLDQRHRRAHELRVVRGVAYGLRVGAIGGLAHFERGVVIAERTPCVGLRGTKLHRTAQTLDGLVATAQAPERQTLERQRLRLVGHHLEDLTGLFEGRVRVGLQQPRRVRERHLESAGRLLGVPGHGLTT